MEVLVAIETVILALLALLVAGLLRSHAEILQRLRVAPEGADAMQRTPQEEPNAPDRPEHAAAFDISGTTLRGEPIQVAVGTQGVDTLLGFLSSGCSTCKEFWEALQPDARGEIPGGARVVLVTRDSSHESPTKLRSLAPPDIPVVMSSAAWEAYEIPQYPYFVYVDGKTGEIAGEGMAQNWEQVVSLLTDAFADLAPDDGANGRPANGRDTRWRREDDELKAAGIGPGHPSLYAPVQDPADAPSEER